jgi:hypothetical protein
VLLAVVAVSASGFQSAAAVVLQRTLDANWRGAYDILVTAKDTKVGVGGLLAPNSLGDGAKGMTLAQLAKVRLISGIDVAAPIGEVMSALQTGQPTVTLPESAVSASQVPQAFRIKSTYTTNDGLSSRYVYSETAYVVIDELPRDAPPAVAANCNLNGFNVDSVKYPHLCQLLTGQNPGQVTVSDQSMTGWGSGTQPINGVLRISASANTQPAGATRITLVDPDAERKLLGQSGAFLAPLQEIRPTATTGKAAMTTRANGTKNSFTSDYLAQQARLGAVQELTPAQKEITAESTAFNKEHNIQQNAGVDTSTYVPLLTSRTPAAALNYTIDVTAIGDAPRKSDGQDPAAGYPYSVSTTAPGTHIGESTIDASGMLNPFDRSPIQLPWPGTPKAAADNQNTYASLGINSAGTISSSKFVGKKKHRWHGFSNAPRLGIRAADHLSGHRCPQSLHRDRRRNKGRK